MGNESRFVMSLQPQLRLHQPQLSSIFRNIKDQYVTLTVI